jgi:hypothetical protein
MVLYPSHPDHVDNRRDPHDQYRLELSVSKALQSHRLQLGSRTSSVKSMKMAA